MDVFPLQLKKRSLYEIWQIRKLQWLSLSRSSCRSMISSLLTTGSTKAPRRSTWAMPMHGGARQQHIWTHRCQTEPHTAASYPEDPAVLKTLRDSELLRRSVSTTPPRFTTPHTLLWEEKCLQFPGKRCLHKVRCDSKSLCDSEFTMQSKFTTA